MCSSSKAPTACTALEQTVTSKSLPFQAAKKRNASSVRKCTSGKPKSVSSACDNKEIVTSKNNTEERIIAIKQDSLRRTDKSSVIKKDKPSFFKSATDCSTKTKEAIGKGHTATRVTNSTLSTKNSTLGNLEIRKSTISVCTTRKTRSSEVKQELATICPTHAGLNIQLEKQDRMSMLPSTANPPASKQSSTGCKINPRFVTSKQNTQAVTLSAPKPRTSVNTPKQKPKRFVHILPATKRKTSRSSASAQDSVRRENIKKLSRVKSKVYLLPSVHPSSSIIPEKTFTQKWPLPRFTTSVNPRVTTSPLSVVNQNVANNYAVVDSRVTTKRCIPQSGEASVYLRSPNVIVTGKPMNSFNSSIADAVPHIVSHFAPRVPSEKTVTSVKREVYQNHLLVQSQATEDDFNDTPKCERVVDNSIKPARITRLDPSHHPRKMHTSTMPSTVTAASSRTIVPTYNKIPFFPPSTSVKQTNPEPGFIASSCTMNVKSSMVAEKESVIDNQNREAGQKAATTSSLPRDQTPLPKPASKQHVQPTLSKPVAEGNCSQPVLAKTNLPQNGTETYNVTQQDKACQSPTSTSLKSVQYTNAVFSSGPSVGASGANLERGHTESQDVSVPGSSSADNTISIVPVSEQGYREVKLPYGSPKIIKLTGKDMGRHIPVWNRKMNYKLAGTSAPLGKNLIAYLEKKQGEYEIYTNQDRRTAAKNTKKSARVTLWNKNELRKISGTSAPLKKNVAKYLKDHPYCEVYNGQAENLDPTLRNREYNRVTLWNKLTCRRTGFGSAGPLRKNLQSYLMRNPHLEEYIGQDKHLEASDVEVDRVMNDEESDTSADTDEGQFVHENERQRWTPQSQSGKRPCESVEEDLSKKEQDSSKESSPNVHQRSPKRYCMVDLSDIPDLNEFPELPIDSFAVPPEWYESFEVFRQNDEENIAESSAEGEEDYPNIPRTLAGSLDTPKTHANLISQSDGKNVHTQVDQFLDLDEEPVLPTHLISPTIEENTFNPDDFLNIDEDRAENAGSQ